MHGFFSVPVSQRLISPVRRIGRDIFKVEEGRTHAVVRNPDLIYAFHAQECDAVESFPVISLCIASA